MVNTASIKLTTKVKLCMIYAYKNVNVIYPDNIKYNSKNLGDGSKQCLLILSLLEE